MAEYTRKIELSKRMQAIADMVPKSGVVADVGCDHGFVSIWLVQNETVQKVIAMDVNKGPLLRAKEHVNAFGLEEYIDLRLSDGLSKVTEEDSVDSVVIAGMGGALMTRILKDALDDRGISVPRFILQPQSEHAMLRAFLREHDYTIVEEKMIFEDGKYYPMLRAEYMAEPLSGVDYDSDLADAFGPLLLKEKHPVLLEFLQKEIGKFERILEQMREKNSQDKQVEDKLVFLRRAEERYAL